MKEVKEEIKKEEEEKRNMMYSSSFSSEKESLEATTGSNLSQIHRMHAW